MPGPKKNFSETQLGDDEEARFGISSGYYWKYDSAAGQYELHTDDDGTGNDGVVIKVDDLSAVLDVMDDLNFPNIAGAPTFSTHDHSEGGLTNINTGGIAPQAVTTSEVDGSGGAAGDVLRTSDGTATGTTWGDAKEQVQYEPGVVNWGDGLSDAEIYRMNLQSGEVFKLRRLEVQLQGGGSAAGLTVDVYDATAATQIDSVSAGSVSTSGGTSGSGNTVLYRLSNSTGSAQDAAPTVRGVIE